MRIASKAQTGGFLNPASLLAALSVKPGSAVADFGCGAGYFSIPFARAVGDGGVVHAIDVRAEPLEALRGRAKLERIYNIVAHRANLEAPNGSGLADGSMDVVFMSNLLFQVTNRAAVVREAGRVLKPGGELVVVEWHGETSLGRMLGASPTPLDVRSLAEGSGLTQEHTLEAGAYHFAVVFRK